MNQPTDPTPAGARFIGAVFGFVFFAIGLTVIIFLVSAGDGFGDPPPFFRIVGSLMGLAFMAMGGTLCVSSIIGKGLQPKISAMAGRLQAMQQEVRGTTPAPLAGAAPTLPGKYVCSRCGAALGDKADVSPLGDTKCPFCGSWFNIHGRSA